MIKEAEKVDTAVVIPQKDWERLSVSEKRKIIDILGHLNHQRCTRGEMMLNEEKLIVYNQTEYDMNLPKRVVIRKLKLFLENEGYDIDSILYGDEEEQDEQEKTSQDYLVKELDDELAKLDTVKRVQEFVKGDTRDTPAKLAEQRIEEIKEEVQNAGVKTGGSEEE